jgi:hypothetical protein
MERIRKVNRWREWTGKLDREAAPGKFGGEG